MIGVRGLIAAAGAPTEVEPGLTLGDYLFGHLEGTRNAFFERARSSITITLPDVTARSLGALIALYERAVGLYAEFVDLNAYDQPGVDKDPAGPVVELQRLAMEYLGQASEPQSVDEIAAAIRRTEDEETIYKVLNRLARDLRRRVARVDGGNKPRFLRVTE